jgi:DNA mismatch endonuclease (patch repair protein)
MRAIRKAETSPERELRSKLHRAGYRFRKNVRDLPGSPDLAFPSRKKAIFVHGCFWHQHEGCPKGVMPAVRREYWEPKLRRNQERDRSAEERLATLGWAVLVIWECAWRTEPQVVMEKVAKFLA